MYKLCFPCIRVKQKINNTNKPKWITKGIKNSCNTKRYLRHKYYLNRNNENKNKYKSYYKLLRKCINNLQVLCNRRHIAYSHNKVKAAWDVVKRNMGNEPCREFISNIVDSDITFTSGSDIANKFNNHFIDVASNTSSNKSNKSSGKHHIETLDNSIFIEPTNESEIFRIINSLRNTKSAGHDNISTELLKKISQYISSPLAYIMNLSIEQGYFPDRLKLSLIKPLHKKGSKTNIDNYRPIALTPIISKIFEKVMSKRLLEFLDKYKIIVNQQYGFRQNKSTTLAIYNLIKTVMTNLNNRIPSCAIFLDLSKAFDLVDHDILIEKMEKYGIRGPAKEWFRSYLSNRKQITRVKKFNPLRNTLENFDSKSRTNGIGVPQGSILGPILFIIYINDLPQSINYPCVLFADDTTIIIEYKNKQNYDAEINETLNDVNKWLDINKLKINIAKTNVLHFKTWKGKPVHLKVLFNNVNVSQVYSTRFLGVTVDEHLTWKNHIDILCKKINQFIFALRKVKDVTSRQTALMVYHAYICSVIRYGIVVWGNSSEVSRVFIAQKKCLRAIFNINWSDSCRPIFKTHKLLTVPCLYIYEAAKFLRSNPTLFERKDNTNKRKATHMDFEMPVPKLELYRRSCVYMAPLIYNALPKAITQLPFKKFCAELRRWLLYESFYSINEFFHKNSCKFYTYNLASKYRH